MRMAMGAFGVVVMLIAIMMFGSMGIAKLFHWMRWSQDSLGFIAMVFILLAGLFLSAWKVWDILWKT